MTLNHSKMMILSQIPRSFVFLSQEKICQNTNPMTNRTPQIKLKDFLTSKDFLTLKISIHS
jgi:hypothetical protein